MMVVVMRGNDSSGGGDDEGKNNGEGKWCLVHHYSCHDDSLTGCNDELV